MPLIDEIGALYPDIDLQVIREDATYIRNAIRDLLQTLLIGGLLSFMVLFTFLNDVRTPFTIGIAIPVSIFMTFFVMFLSDIQLNIISLSGLTLGIGLLVDNAIVVLENINRHRLRSEEHTSELQSRGHLVCRLLLETKNIAFGNVSVTTATTSITSSLDIAIVSILYVRHKFTEIST